MGKLSYDVIVIGAGSTGGNVADRSMKGGLTAVVVECEVWLRLLETLGL
jgi:dihydrolipoamide dehydrogenase